MLDHLQRGAELFLTTFANQATPRSGKKLKINTALPGMLHPRGEEVCVVREESVLRFDPCATVTNWKAIPCRKRSLSTETCRLKRAYGSRPSICGAVKHLVSRASNISWNRR